MGGYIFSNEGEGRRTFKPCKGPGGTFPKNEEERREMSERRKVVVAKRPIPLRGTKKILKCSRGRREEIEGKKRRGGSLREGDGLGFLESCPTPTRTGGGERKKGPEEFMSLAGGGRCLLLTSTSGKPSIIIVL